MRSGTSLKRQPCPVRNSHGCLRQIERKTLVFGVTFKAQDQFDLLQSSSKAGVDGINQCGKIKGGLGLLGPSSRGSEKLVAAHFADEQLCNRRIFHQTIREVSLPVCSNSAELNSIPFLSKLSP